MLTSKEITAIIIATLILAFSYSLASTPDNFTSTLVKMIGFVFIVIIINITAKKVMASYKDASIETSLWTLKRAGILHFINIIPFHRTHPSQKFKSEFPIGILLPIITTVLSFGWVKWLACLTFESKAQIYRAARIRADRHQRYAEITETHEAQIAATGILANLLFAYIFYLLGQPILTKINITFAFYNLIPISNLDGNKIFFGSSTDITGYPLLWTFLSVITVFAMLLTLFI